MNDRAADVPRIVLQRNHELLARTDDVGWPAARDALRPFAELVRLGGGYATFRLTPLSLWNAAAAGLDAGAIGAALRGLSATSIPPSTTAFIHETLARAGLGGWHGLALGLTIGAHVRLHTDRGQHQIRQPGSVFRAMATGSKGRFHVPTRVSGTEQILEEARALSPVSVNIAPVTLKEMFLETVAGGN